MALNNFEIPKTLTESDVRDKVGLPVEIVDLMNPVMNGENGVDLIVFDRWGQKWRLKYYTRPNGERKPVFTAGWRQLVAANGVIVGDKLIFSRHQDAGEMQYMIQVKRQIMNLQGELVTVEVMKSPTPMNFLGA